MNVSLLARFLVCITCICFTSGWAEQCQYCHKCEAPCDCGCQFGKPCTCKDKKAAQPTEAAQTQPQPAPTPASANGPAANHCPCGCPCVNGCDCGCGPNHHCDCNPPKQQLPAFTVQVEPASVYDAYDNYTFDDEEWGGPYEFTDCYDPCYEAKLWFPYDDWACWDGPCQPCDCSLIWLPEAPPLFKPFAADPRQVCYSVGWRFDDDLFDKNLAPISYGDYIGLFRIYCPWGLPGALEFGIDGGLWAIFEQTQFSAPLVNADYYVGFPLEYAVGPWSFRLRGYHISSHIGDEFLLNNLGFDRRNASSEYVDLFASYNFNPCTRIYGGIGAIVRSDTTFHRKPFYAEYGGELFFSGFGYYNACSSLVAAPFAAAHFRNYQDFNYRLDSNIALGFEFRKLVGLERKTRVFIEWHRGFSSEGQFCHFRTEYYTLRLTYGY